MSHHVPTLGTRARKKRERNTPHTERRILAFLRAHPEADVATAISIALGIRMSTLLEITAAMQKAGKFAFREPQP